MAAKQAASERRKPQKGNKRQFLLTIGQEIINFIKLAAIKDEPTASEIIEEAVVQWLERRKSKAKKV
jgi:hypothetical protein